jgi:hypothetical protein
MYIHQAALGCNFLAYDALRSWLNAIMRDYPKLQYQSNTRLCCKLEASSVGVHMKAADGTKLCSTSDARVWRHITTHRAEFARRTRHWWPYSCSEIACFAFRQSIQFCLLQPFFETFRATTTFQHPSSFAHAAVYTLFPLLSSSTC